jgi:uncharacterized protein YjbI with pentapeptide repeats
MVRDESIGDVRTALRHALADRLDDYPALRRDLEDFCLTAIGENLERSLDFLLFGLLGAGAAGQAPGMVPPRMVRHGPVALMLAADRITSLLEDDPTCTFLARPLARELVEEAARGVTGSRAALRHLEGAMIRSDQSSVHPMAASLLHAATPGWRLNPVCRPLLAGAFLNRARWPGIHLEHVDLHSADLSEADLCQANLENADATEVRFRRAKLEKAILNSGVALKADFSGANLRSVLAKQASFRQANLSRACLAEADLSGANLQGANIEDADFRGANLEGANLVDFYLVDLRDAKYTAFQAAHLRSCRAILEHRGD